MGNAMSSIRGGARAGASVTDNAAAVAAGNIDNVAVGAVKPGAVGGSIDDIAESAVKAPIGTTFKLGTSQGTGVFVKIGDTVPTGVKAIDVTGFSAAGREGLESIAKQYPGSRLVDAGKAIKGQITWTRVAIVSGLVLVAVILINPETGERISEAVLGAGAAVLSPFIPSLVFSCFCILCLFSLGFGGYMMMKQIR